MSRNRTVFALALVILLFFWFTRLENSAVLATQADEGVHVTVAELVNTGSRRIYVDLFENRTPGAEWLLSGWFRLTGPTIFTARVLSIAMMTVTYALVFAFTRYASLFAGASSKIATVAGMGAATLYALDPLALFWSRFAMLEHFSTAAALAAILVASIARQRQSQAYWLCSGLLAALTVIFKQTEVVLLAAFVVFFALHAVTVGGRRAFSAALAWTSGLMMAAGLFFVTLALQGSLQPFIQFATNAGQLAPLAEFPSKLYELTAWFQRTPALWFSLPALIFAFWRRRSSLQLVLLWFAAETAFLFMPPQLDLRPGGFSHYALPAIAASAAFSASGTALLWQALGRQGAARQATTLLFAIALFAFLPAWYGEYRTNLHSTAYPESTVLQEREIGRATALLTDPDEPILVLGNAVFYHRAGRTPAARFFHWPEYLAQSDLVSLAIDSTTSALSGDRAGAVLVSRLHLEERLPQEVLAPLWRNWIPATLFPYPYQRDVVLFVPRVTSRTEEPALATFDGGVTLLSLEALWLDPGNLLVSLWWRSEEALEDSFTVFVHVMDEQEVILAQDDAIPVVGFRPTTTWQVGEAVLDYHWIRVPDGTDPNNLRLNVGLYESATGERLHREDNETARDAFRRALEPVP